MSDDGQLSFDAALTPSVRSTDGQPSVDAAGLGGRAAQRRLVLKVLRDHGPLHDEGIARRAKIEKGSAAKRRLELVRLGYVEHVTDQHDQPIRIATKAGVKAYVWQITNLGRGIAL